MDAATFRKLNFTVPMLLVSAALALPWTAQAQPSLQLSASSVTINGQAGASVTVTSSDSSHQITFNVTSNPNWVSINGGGPTAGPLTTPQTLTFSNGSTNGSPQPATVTLTPTSPSGVQKATISVSFTNNNGGGGTGGSGGGNGGTGNDQLFASSTSISASSAGGAQTSQSFQLSNNGPDNVNFNFNANPTSWLTVTSNTNTIAAGQAATITLLFNASNLSAATYPTSFTINNLTTTSQTITIAVNFTVTTNSVLSLTPTSASWGSTSSATQVTIGSPSPTFSAVSNASWISLSFGNGSFTAPSLSNISTSGGLIVEFTPGATAPATNTTGTVTITDGTNTANFTVTYTGTGGGSSTGAVTITPSPITLNSAAGSGCCSQATATISSTIAGSVTIGLTGSFGSSVSYSFPNGASTGNIGANSSINITLTGNASGLSTQTYTGTLTATVTPTTGNAAQGSAQVNLVIGSGSGSGGGTSSATPVLPTSLSFAADTNHPTNVSPQAITLTSTGSYTATASENSDCGSSSWLSVSNPTGTANGAGAPAQVPVQVNATGLPVGTCTGTVTVVTTSGSTNVNVSLQVFNSAVIYAQTGTNGGNGSITLAEISGNIVGVVPPLYVVSSDGTSKSLTATTDANWLTVTNSGGTLTNTNNSGFNIFLSAANLANGVYVGHVIFTGSAANSPLSVPVVISVTGSSAASGLTLSQSTLTLNGTANGGLVTGQLGVSSNTSVAFTASATTNSGGNWLSVTQSGTAPQNITITANPAGLSANTTYTGTVTVSSSIGTAQATVNFAIGSGGGAGGSIACSPSPCGTLTFQYTLNGSTPSSQTTSIVSASGAAATSFTVSSSVNGSVPNWLTAVTGTGGTVGTTPGSVIVTVNPAGLQPAQYTGIVTASSTNNSVQIPITLIVQASPTVTANPSSLTFGYQAGGPTPSAGQLNVGGTASGLPYSVTVSTNTGGSWLSVNKTSGTTPDVLSVTVNPANLTAGQSYTGTIIVNGTGSASGSTAVQVTLTITAPFPTITQVQNGASFSNGPVSPGEIVTLFGTALGPATPLGTTLTSAGKVATQLGNVQVLFNGFPAPLLYVSATQINCVVPYELAGFTQPYVQVKFLGQTSNAFNLTSSATAPGIFATGTPAGTGQGAILNFDNSPNSSANPAAPGSVVQVYMTGEGVLSPAQSTGSVTCSAGCATTSAIPKPLLTVGALVNNQPATIAFYGDAPGFVSGVLQVNVVIPPNTPAGNIPISISVGGINSQNNVTVAVH